MWKEFPRCYFASRELIDGFAMRVTSDRDHVNTPSWREIRGVCVWGGGWRLSDLPPHTQLP